MFRDEAVREMYREKPNKSLIEYVIQETNDVDNTWNNIEKGHLKPAEEMLGERKTVTRIEWITNNIVDTNMINERRMYENSTRHGKI